MGKDRKPGWFERLNSKIYMTMEAFLVSFASPQYISPFFRFLFRVPVWFYRHGMWFFVGGNMLLLTTTGRKSGLPRYTCLSYGQDKQSPYRMLRSDTYQVMPGWGDKCDWLLNIRANAHVTVQTGKKRIECQARFLSEDESAREYAKIIPINPFLKSTFSRWTGETIDGSPDSLVRVAKKFPMIEFTPTNGGIQ
jgi:deazaflavin-dependent oxidoreductase (nitroreductase family)